MSVGGLRIILAVPRCKARENELRSEAHHQSDYDHLGCYVVFPACLRGRTAAGVGVSLYAVGCGCGMDCGG